MPAVYSRGVVIEHSTFHPAAAVIIG
jgi:hypothetical protein